LGKGGIRWNRRGTEERGEGEGNGREKRGEKEESIEGRELRMHKNSPKMQRI